MNSSGELVPDPACMNPPEVIDPPDSNCSNSELVPDPACMNPPEVIDPPDSNCSNSELEPDLECMNSTSAEDPSRESDSISVGVAVGAAVAIVVVVTIAIVVLIMLVRKHKLQIKKQMITDPISPRRYIHNISMQIITEFCSVQMFSLHADLVGVQTRHVTMVS